MPTFTKKALVTCCLLLAGILGCQEPLGYSDETPRAPVGHLWSATVKPYLAYDLWTEDESYDAGHHLMVPLHAAFRLRESDWQHAFADQFGRFATQWSPGTIGSRNILNTLQG